MRKWRVLALAALLCAILMPVHHGASATRCDEPFATVLRNQSGPSEQARFEVIEDRFSLCKIWDPGYTGPGPTPVFCETLPIDFDREVAIIATSGIKPQCVSRIERRASGAT